MITPSEVLAIHEMVLAAEGGLAGDHGHGALESVCARVANQVRYAGLNDIFQIAAMYALAIARGHVFNDANKRTALLTALCYLASEGAAIPPSPQLEDVTVDLAQGLLTQQELAQILFSLVQTAPD